MYEYAEPQSVEDIDKPYFAGYNPAFVAQVLHRRREAKRLQLEEKLRAKRERLEAARQFAKEASREARAAQRQVELEQAKRSAEKASKLVEIALERMSVVDEDAPKTDMWIFAEQETRLYGYSLRELRELKTRKADIVLIKRAVVVAVYNAYPDVSLTRIGNLLALDHTSVLNHVKKAGVWRNPGRPGTKKD